ncbi:radical SAM family heme chaperone HemW [Simiduia curdlanivorans]|uniref:Heme chaperone HemW n=1 Tax=Simiduia curdlanivorans TaxID=1492769 RepID=A0ABV8V304_9GAMM|nr:radical SAM family heme chaperone HemW [Simiduia curdlanivorans]MDN3637747.1 radical SAM family heme chaperone HemW [Simiduia curdlanivorans]
MALSLPPLSLYVHIPWCVRKCPYCDFNSHKAGPDLPEQAYVQALLRDMQDETARSQDRALSSIFFGGGTPSLFSAQAIGDIIQGAERHFGFEPNIEITLEANPGTAEQSRFHGYRAAGVNRLSIGVQSFNPQHLQHLGRIHSGREAIDAVAMARAAGFDNFNLDLMHGLPGQTPEDAGADLTQALDLAPNHLSWYQLTIEPNTEFFRRPPVLPVEDTLADIQDLGCALLSENGLQQYEISAYAKPNKEAAHNLNYWRFGDYIGIGAGAHGKLSRWVDNSLQIHRHWKTRLPEHYLKRTDNIAAQRFEAGTELIEAQDLPLEFMMNALRLNDGVEESLFQQRTGLAIATIAQPLQRLREQGLVSADRLQPTALGSRYLNRLLPAFEAI